MGFQGKMLERPDHPCTYLVDLSMRCMNHAAPLRPSFPVRPHGQVSAAGLAPLALAATVAQLLEPTVPPHQSDDCMLRAACRTRKCMCNNSLVSGPTQ